VPLWLGWGDFREPAEFVETIPFGQTRDYVQIILRNLDFYRWLYGASPARAPAQPAPSRKAAPKPAPQARPALPPKPAAKRTVNTGGSLKPRAKAHASSR